MTEVLVDSSVVIDIFNEGSAWFDWSAKALRELRRESELLINQVIFAECVTAYRIAGDDAPRIDELFVRRPLPWEAAVLAGEAHAAYRRRGGSRAAILPDFLIAAHARAEDLVLLTRDPIRARTAFPDLEIVTPNRL